jgi:hypothetical protein
MNKAIVALVLVLAVSTQPALAGKRQAADAPNTKVKDETASWSFYGGECRTRGM